MVLVEEDVEHVLPLLNERNRGGGPVGHSRDAGANGREDAGTLGLLQGTQGETASWPPLVITCLRILLALLVMPLAVVVGAAVGLALVPHSVYNARRKLMLLLLPTRKPLGVKVYRVVACLIGMMLLAALATLLGAIFGPIAALLRAVYGPSAQCEPWQCSRPESDLHRKQLPTFNDIARKAQASGKCTLVSEHIAQEDRSHTGIYLMHMRTIIPEDCQRKGLLIFHHGLHSHGGARHNMELALFFASHGYVTCLPDAKGHGLSGGARASVPSFDDMARDLAFVADQLCKKYPTLPLFLMGESLGGLTVLLSHEYFSRRCANAVIGVMASCPAFMIPGDTSRSWADDIADLLPLELLVNAFPKLPITPSIRGNCYPSDLWLRDRAMQVEDNDPLVYKGWIKLATAVAFKITLLDSSGRAKILDRVKYLDKPLLLQHGTRDLCVDCAGSRKILEAVQSQTKRLIEYPGKCHTLMTECDRTKKEYLGNSLQFCESLNFDNIL